LVPWRAEREPRPGRDGRRLPPALLVAGGVAGGGRGVHRGGGDSAGAGAGSAAPAVAGLGLQEGRADEGPQVQHGRTAHAPVRSSSPTTHQCRKCTPLFELI